MAIAVTTAMVSTPQVVASGAGVGIVHVVLHTPPARNSDMPTERPNVLFIPVDDLRPQLGCYGQSQMVPPHIDRLAEEGVVFTRAYCQVPVCGATRASLLSGVRPTRDRFLTYMTWVDQDLPGCRTLPQHFREHGYTCLADGKVFHHATDTAERSWSAPPWHPRNDPHEHWRNYLLEENRKTDADDEHRGPPVECADVLDNAYYDGRIADRAIADLHKLAEAEQPFFLAAGFLKPHLPFNAPKHYWDYYRRSNITPADNPFRPRNAPEQALHNWGELRSYAGIPREGPVSEEQACELIHGYYAATSYVDAQVGRLLAELDRLGLRERTIVVLWGDHGWQLGEHGLWCKHCNFNTSLNAPLVVSAPGMGHGKPCDGLVEFLDVFPSLCDLAGLPVPDTCEGASFVGQLDDPGSPGKEAAFSRYFGGESVRTDRCLYTEWRDEEGRRTARMLYDHSVDAAENENISELPGNAALVDRLSRMLPVTRRTE